MSSKVGRAGTMGLVALASPPPTPPPRPVHGQTPARCTATPPQISLYSGHYLKYRGGGGSPGIFRTRKFRTGLISHSALKIPREIWHPSRIVLFTTGQFLCCTAKFQRIPGLFCEFPGASRIAFFTFRGFLHDLVLNPMPQGPKQSSPFICLSALGHNKHQFPYYPGLLGP